MKVTWTSHEDQARVAVAALARPELAGQSFEIGTPAALTRGDLAELLSDLVGKPVTYAPQTAQQLGDHMAQVSGDPGMGFALTDLYGALGNMGDDTMVIDTDLIEQTFGVSAPI